MKRLLPIIDFAFFCVAGFYTIFLMQVHWVLLLGHSVRVIAPLGGYIAIEVILIAGMFVWVFAHLAEYIARLIDHFDPPTP